MPTKRPNQQHQKINVVMSPMRGCGPCEIHFYHRGRWCRRSSVSSFVVVLSSSLLVMLLSLTNAVGHVEVWDAHDHVVGKWDVMLHGMAENNPHNKVIHQQECKLLPQEDVGDVHDDEIFPLVQQSVVMLNKNNGSLNPPTTTIPKTSRRRRRRTSNNIRCHLFLFPNGTFTLQPATATTNEIQCNKNNNNRKQQSQLPQHRDVLHLHGRWKVKRNPHCITDRFYDQLFLDAYPRVQKLWIPKQPHHPQQQSQQQPVILQQQAIQLSCRIWGRYSRQRRQQQTRQQQRPGSLTLARMTHGSLLLWDARPQDDDDNNDKRHTFGSTKDLDQQPSPRETLITGSSPWLWWKPFQQPQHRRRRIAATFTGRLVSNTVHDMPLPKQDDHDGSDDF